VVEPSAHYLFRKSGSLSDPYTTVVRSLLRAKYVLISGAYFESFLSCR